MQSAARRVPDPTVRWVVALAVAVLALVPLIAGSALAAQDRQVTSGDLTWGVKQSFRSYVTGFIAQGKITTASGASQAAGNGVFTFTRGTGTVRADGGADLAFAGSVNFYGHHGDLDVTLADPSITVNGSGSGHLTVKHTLDGKTTSVRVATVTGATVATQGDTATLKGAKTSLTEAGRAVFSMDGTREGSFYSAGDELDPASADLSLAPGVGEPTTPPTTTPPTTTPPTTTPPTTTPPTTTPPTPTPTQRSGRLAWGVKSSFRSYVGGPIARGKVTTSGHASTAANGTYLFPQRSTSAKPPSPTGTTSYRGQVAFYGHHGDLDMRLRNPRVIITSPTTGRLVVESRPTGATAFRTITVSSLDLTKGARSSAGGSLTYSGVPVTLSSAGTSLFTWDGRAMYPAGTAMDPVTFTIGSNPSVSGSGTPTTTRPKGGTGTSGPGGTGSQPSGAGAPAAAARESAGVGSLTWGLRTSFRDYITGPIAHGSIAVSGGARSTGRAFSFPQSGAARQDGGAGYRGTVTFRGHGGILNLSLADPAVSIDSARSGTLTAQVAGRRIPVASLNLGASARSTSRGATAYANVPATLTAQGASLFSYNGSSFYPAGTAMDPVTFTVGSAASATGSDETTTETVASAGDRSSASSDPATAARGTRSPAARDACVATGSDLTWGFKESFRSYVSGSIANGDWSTSGGADYSTPHFSWGKGKGKGKGKGRFDAKTRTGSVAFPGTVAFTGHDGKLNTTVSDPQIRIEGDRALLVLDVKGASMDAAMEGRDDTTSYPDTPFVEVDLSEAKVETAGGRTTITASEAPTTLTPQGQRAFSNYEAGTVFDPVSFTITATSTCLAPTKTATAAPTSATPTAAIGAPGSGLPGWVPWVAGAGLGAAAAAAATVLVTRRRAGGIA